MTEEKMRKVIAAIVSAVTVLLVTLLSVLVYQWGTMAVLDKRIATVEAEIVELQNDIATADTELEYYTSKMYLDQKLIEYQELKDKK